MRPLHARGAKETKKQRLRRELKMERAGILKPGESSDGKGLIQVRSRREEEEEDEEEEEEEGRAGVFGSKSVERPPSAEMEEDGQEKEEEVEVPPSAPSPPPIVFEEPDDGSKMKKLMATAREEARMVKQEHGINDDDEDKEAEMRRSSHTAAAARVNGSSVLRVKPVTRPPAMEEARSGLPITGMEREIMEAVSAYDVICLCGETGSGKTTQVPQFLLEAGYGCKEYPEKCGFIGITQPRRVAAVSTATRVAEELGEKMGKTVGYQIRYDKKVGSDTAIKFNTDGIVLRELQDDFLLSKYSAIIVDEAHERSLNTDILIGMLSRIVPLRRKLFSEGKTHSQGQGQGQGSKVYPLKLIIMSATLRTGDFTGNTKLFPSPPPVVNVPARQYPVTVHFSRRTEMTDYIAAAFKKVSCIHKDLPAGAILVFVTGQREVEQLCEKLRMKLGKKSDSDNSHTHEDDDEAAMSILDGGGEDQVEAYQAVDNEPGHNDLLDDYDEAEGEEDEEDVVVLGGDAMTQEEIKKAESTFERIQPLGVNHDTNKASVSSPVHVLPLYAMLPQSAQALVFKPPPAGHRLIVIATNVAETSLTIPGIRYVVDAGRSKQKLIEHQGGLARYEVRWISKASAMQRAGRAGRTGPGHCYRLFSSAHFNDTFPDHTPPEISNTPLESVVLLIKSLGVDKISNFPFPSPPDPASLSAANDCLTALSAVDSSGALTPMGRAMILFPLSPRHSRMLIEVLLLQHSLMAEENHSAVKRKGSKKENKALPYALALAAALSVESPFVHIEAVVKKRKEGEGGEEEDMDRETRDKLAQERHLEDRERKALEEKRNKASSAHYRLRHPDSDAISSMRALCEYLGASDGESFCHSNFLHPRTLTEMASLHSQLTFSISKLSSKGLSPPSYSAMKDDSISKMHHGLSSAISSISSSSTDVKALEAELRGTVINHPQPSASIVDTLRKAIVSGWADHVARRLKSSDSIQKQRQEEAEASAEGVGFISNRALRYTPCSLLDQDIYLHPRSILHKSAPQFLVYTELVRTAKRPYMSGLTAIDPSWLSECGSPLAVLSDPLDAPPPFYCPKPQDCVMAWHQVTYGKSSWSLPKALRPHPDPWIRASVFASALLDGNVIVGTEGLKSLLVMPPVTASKQEMKGIARVGELVGALERAKVDSLKTLTDALSNQGAVFLLRELGMWVAKQDRGKLNELWNEAVSQTVGAGHGVKKQKK